jgi:acyl-CoA thioester hydrolase
VSEPAVFRRSRRIAPDDLDFLGHVNNVVWLRFVVELAEGHAASLDVGSRIVRERGGQWIVRRHELDYHDNAGIDEEIVEETWVESMRGARSVRRARFSRVSDGKELVTATTQWAFVDAETLRPKRIPPELLGVYRTKGD